MIHALLLLLATAAPTESGYVWPLKLEPALTSSTDVTHAQSC